MRELFAVICLLAALFFYGSAVAAILTLNVWGFLGFLVLGGVAASLPEWLSC